MRTQDLFGYVFALCAISAVSVSASPVEKRLPSTPKSKHLRPHYLSKPDEPGYAEGNPIDGKGKGAPLLGGTDKAIDIENPANLGQESTDAGAVKNLKWRFSDSKTRQLPGGWVREQVITDLPASKDIAGAQQHLTKNSIREMHWHRVAEWGYVYHGQVAVSAVDEDGRNQVEVLNEGDIWYFPKGEAHVIQGLADQNEYLLVFDDGDFEAPGTSFNVDDWIAHTPKDILAKSLGIDPSLLASVPSPNPYILKTNLSSADLTIDSPYGKLEGNSSYVFKASEVAAEEVPGGGGTVKTVDSRNFPVAKTIASSIVTLKPGALRELHWHPNAEEWLYFLSGSARATVFVGNAAARTFDFSAGDTAVFPDNAGHYVQNTSPNETLQWIEIYKSDRVVDISLTQWLALTPAGIVAETLKIPVEVARGLRKEKQLEDLPNGNPISVSTLPSPYQSLAYNAFGYGAPLATSLTLGLFQLGNIQPSSKPNLFVARAPYVVTGGLGTPEITTVYEGSNVVSFDAESAASGCYVATNNGAEAPGIDCTIRWTGEKAVTGPPVTFDAIFTVGQKSIAGISVFAPEPVQKKLFPANFNGLRSLKPEIVSDTLPVIPGFPVGTVQMVLDDFAYTAHVKK